MNILQAKVSAEGVKDNDFLIKLDDKSWRYRRSTLHRLNALLFVGRGRVGVVLTSTILEQELQSLCLVVCVRNVYL